MKLRFAPVQYKHTRYICYVNVGSSHYLYDWKAFLMYVLEGWR